MKNLLTEFGKGAGKIWNALNTQGALTEQKLIKITRLSQRNFYGAIGWLARENKIYKTGNNYQLGQTNLTDQIGANAGKLWNTLTTCNEIDISTIPERTQIHEHDAYSALGWLAREDKITTKTVKNKQTKITIK